MLELSKMPEANYLLSVSWGYIKVGFVAERIINYRIING